MKIPPLALLALAAVTASAADPVSLGLVFRHGSPVPHAVLASFEEQTERGLRQIMPGTNLNVTWRGEGEAARGQAWDRLIMVRFQGDCTMSMRRPLPHGGALGATWMTDGQILPFIDIDCGRVKATLAHAGLWQQSLIPPAVLGRALSHVALHEIYHVLSERTQHDSNGLFKAKYSAEDLMAPAVQREKRPAVLTGLTAQR
jgi:hypothetical protein